MNEEVDLTPEDPVSKEVLSQLQELDDVRISLGLRLLTIESERVQLLGANKKAMDQTRRLIEGVLVDRGLPPDAPVSIDPITGKLELVKED
jgi:hypothetical protein